MIIGRIMKIFNAKSKKIKILAFAFSVMAVAALIGFTFATPKVDAAELCVNGMKEEYFVGERFVVPEASFKISETETVPATFTVRTPEGDVLQASEFSLNSYGKYTLMYTARKGNEKYSKNVSFDVVKPLFELDGYGSVEYGVHDYFKDGDGNALVDSAAGLMVGLGEDTTLKYNRKIDLTTLTKNDSLITYNVTPEKIGYWEAQTVNFKLVDEKDPSKFIVLVTDSYGSNSSSYVWAGINETSTMYVGNTFYKATIGVQRGIATNLSFSGQPDASVGGIVNNTVSFNFDYLNKQIWLYNNGKYTQLLDLGSFENVFGGFSTGRVLLEVYVGKCRGDKCNFVVRDIAGANLQGSKLYDSEPPVITVNYGEYGADSYPNGAVGYGYPIFEASANDFIDGETSVNAYVYYNYYSEGKISVAIENGTFVPNKNGVYTICYVAKDKFGNEAVERVDVNVSSQVNPIQIQVESGKPATCSVGDVYTLASAQTTGGNGNVKLEVKATLGGTNLEIVNGKIRFTQSGTCTVTYTATDYVGQKQTSTVEITVNDVDAPVFVSDVDAMIEKVFIAGNKYKLPEVTAIAKVGGSYSSVQTTVSADNGAVSGGYYVPATLGEANLTFTATAGGKSTSVTVKRSVYSLKDSEGLLDFKKLFIAGEQTVASYGDGGFAKYSVTGDQTLTFANKLLTEAFSATFSFEKNGLGAIELVLTDVYDPDVQLRMLVTKTRGAGVLTVNGGTGHAVGARFTIGEESDISYKNSQRKLTLNTYEFDVSNVFGGFTSDYAYFSINMIDVTSATELVIKKVGNQLLKGDVKVDMIAPVVAVAGDYGGNYALGYEYKVTKVLAHDVVLGDVADFTMSVKRPNGSFVSVDGVEIKNVAVKEFSFTLSEYGSYSLSFIAKDDNGNKMPFTYVVHVLDDQAPVITVKGSYAKSGKVGDTVTVATVNVSDNLDEVGAIKLVTMLKLPSGELSVIDKTFKAEESGVYTVYYYATDTFGNFSISQYQIEIN